MIEKEQRQREVEKNMLRDGVNVIEREINEQVLQNDSKLSTADEKEDENGHMESHGYDSAMAAVRETAASLVTYVILDALQHVCALHTHTHTHVDMDQRGGVRMVRQYSPKRCTNHPLYHQTAYLYRTHTAKVYRYPMR